MNGVVSLLDEVHDQKVRRLWAELERRFGLTGIQVTPYPHFSYHVAAAYDQPALLALLAQFAREAAVFTVRATGLGIFTGEEPVVYIPVTRTAVLTQLHQSLWPQIEPLSQGSVGYYEPQQWLPHITLGHADITGENIGPIISWLNGQALNWHITVDNLGLISDESGAQTLQTRFDFT